MIKHPQDRSQRLQIKKLKNAKAQRQEASGPVWRKQKQQFQEQETQDELRKAQNYV